MRATVDEVSVIDIHSPPTDRNYVTSETIVVLTHLSEYSRWDSVGGKLSSKIEVTTEDKFAGLCRKSA